MRANSFIYSNVEEGVDLSLLEVDEEEMTSGDEEGMNGELALADEDLEEVEDEDLLDDEEDDMALNLASGDDGQRGPPDIHLVQMRIASATRALGDWRIHGKKTGKSRSEIYDQFINDICSYYGYNKFLAEKLVDLFSVDEVCTFFLAYCTTVLTLASRWAVHYFLRRLRYASSSHYSCQHPQNPPARTSPNSNQSRSFFRAHRQMVEGWSPSLRVQCTCRRDTRVPCRPLYTSSSFVFLARHGFGTAAKRKGPGYGISARR